MASIFTKIINGDIPCHKVAEDEHNLAFLDIMPLRKGHVLVIPKKEVDYLYDLSDEDFLSLQLFAKKVATGMRKVLPCKRIGTTVIGLEVPHAHIHLIPIYGIADMNFAQEKLKLDQELMQSLASQISEAI